jgi:hypothetical protein
MKTKKALSDVSMFEAYDEGTTIAKGTRVICVTDEDDDVRKGSWGVTIEDNAFVPSVKWENEDFNKIPNHFDFIESFNLAPFPDELYNKLVLGVEDEAKDERIE